MQQHAMRTAATLYTEGTLDVETAANHAGVTATRLERYVERCGRSVSSLEADAPAGRVQVAAD